MLRIFDIADPRHVYERAPAMKFDGAEYLSGVAAISDDGQVAAAGTANGTVYTWDLSQPVPQRTGEPIAGATDSFVGALAMTPHGELLFAASSDSMKVTVIDRSDTSRPRPVRMLDNGDLVQLLAVSSDGQLLAVATATTINIWDLGGGVEAIHQIGTLGGFKDTISVVEFSGRLLAAGSEDKTIRLWNLTYPSATQEVAQVSGPAGAVMSSLTINTQATRMAAGIGNDQIWVWDITNPTVPTEFAVLYSYGSRVNDVAYGPNGDSFTAGGPDRTLRTWSTDPDAVTEQLCSHTAAILTRDEWTQHLPGVPFTAPCPAAAS